MTTTVVSSLPAVLLLALAANAASVPAASTRYYEPIVPYGPYPAPGYIVSAYLPKYTSYPPVPPVRYPPKKTDYDEDQYKDEEHKYYYGGKFTGVCSIDGLYYKNEKSFVVCSNGYASYQPCPPGTKTDKFPSYKAGYYYGSSDLCSVNMVDFGYGPFSYMHQIVSYDSHTPTSYDDKPPVTSYGSDEPKKEDPPYRPSGGGSSYESPPKDPYPPPPPSYDSSPSSTSYYVAAPSYPPRQPYQPTAPDYPPQSSYAVDHPPSSDPYRPATGSAGSYPPKNDGYSSGSDYDPSPPRDPYKPSPPAKPYPPRDPYVSSGTVHYYKPSPSLPSSSYYGYPADYKQETGTGYSDKDDH